MTKDFVLDHVFDMMPARHIRSEKDLVLTLMRRHYRGRRIPKILDGRFIDTLKAVSYTHLRLGLTWKRD